ncbi:F0F1 ATP synthase subunit A [Microvirga sp. 3-52]|uniref:F0F1 ATP synthase subunit A n=1 Tax=Microvirga sp. 3-52 TaxID=2792425 RepID=UPI001AD453FB|nr:F0F1 ATP synthase subunit A [Microvirga sp. 3-52]MBO1905323.1 F0F1 ATP synthase subunit A [Microvirga sp. 3-52]MBS7452588.1 F0F1 ATP synthase subunit A [Microvirga sp. 3-52]
MASPIEQFVVKTVVPLGNVGGVEIGLTNAAVFMMLAVVLIVGGLVWATREKALVPGRAQAVAEMLHEFIAGTLQDAAGREGMKFFPLVFSLFVFVLTLNLLGMIPGGFTVTSQIVVTFGLALLVIGTVIGYGFMRHGFRFLGLFVPSGVPKWLLPVLVVIEIISFLSRPISLSLRLFANMLGGHIALKVFGGFVVALGTAGAGYVLLAPLPLAMTVALTGFEFLVAALQAYVFAVLTCIYLNDAIHPGH